MYTSQAHKHAEVHVTRGKALADYLAMGTSRSLAKLRQDYANNGLHPPSISTLKAWSSAGGWTLEAAEYDRNVERATRQALIQKHASAQAEESFNIEQGIVSLFRIAMFKASEAMANAPVSSIRDAERCVHISKALLELDAAFRHSQLSQRSKTAAQLREEALTMNEIADMLRCKPQRSS